jgi:hypothetical protein
MADLSLKVRKILTSPSAKDYIISTPLPESAIDTLEWTSAHQLFHLKMYQFLRNAMQFAVHLRLNEFAELAYHLPVIIQFYRTDLNDLKWNIRNTLFWRIRLIPFQIKYYILHLHLSRCIIK